jgi:uncharacterized protein with GYD domain
VACGWQIRSNMAFFILLTTISGGSLHTPETYQLRERQVVDRVRNECPEVHWVQNLAVCGPYDYVDVFTAPTLETAMTVSVLVRTYGRAYTELWPALGWDDFEKLVKRLPSTPEPPPPTDIEE